MNVFGKREKRGWRKARKRGVSPIIATILLVAITVVLAAVLYVLISSLTTGGASTVPIGTTFTLGAATQSTSSSSCNAHTSPGDCYSLSNQSAGSSATTGNIHFSVLLSGTGQTGWTVNLVSDTGTVLTHFAAGGTSWSATYSFNSTQTIFVDSASSMSGMSLQAIGVGALSGTESYALP